MSYGRSVTSGLKRRFRHRESSSSVNTVIRLTKKESIRFVVALKRKAMTGGSNATVVRDRPVDCVGFDSVTVRSAWGRCFGELDFR